MCDAVGEALLSNDPNLKHRFPCFISAPHIGGGTPPQKPTRRPGVPLGGSRLATWNVNSLKVRLPQVLQWLAANPVDVLCLQETKTTRR